MDELPYEAAHQQPVQQAAASFIVVDTLDPMLAKRLALCASDRFRSLLSNGLWLFLPIETIQTLIG